MLESEIIEQNMGLVKFFANKVYKPPRSASHYDIEDLIQVGSIGLLKAARSFKPEKNVKFSTYAARCITNEIFMFYRRLKKLNSLPTLDQVIANQAEGTETETTYTDMIPGCHNVESDILAAELKLFLEQEFFVNRRKNRPDLDERDKQVFYLKMQGATQREISNELGVSQSYVSRIQKSIEKQIEEKWVN
jgi:RNA polymerase sporulation-specific sigma factor